MINVVSSSTLTSAPSNSFFGSVAIENKSIIFPFRLAPLFTRQTNRGAQDKQAISIKDIAEDFQKTQIADAVVTIATKKKAQDEMIAKLVLNRGDRQGMCCGIRRNYDIGQFMINSWEIQDDEDADQEEEIDAPARPLFGERYKK